MNLMPTDCVIRQFVLFAVLLAQQAVAQTFPWAKNATGTASAVATDNSGNVFIAGYFNGPSTTIGQATINNSGNTALLIAKIDTTGAVIWARSAIADVAYGTGIAVDGMGNILLAGDFNSSTAAFGPTTLVNATANYSDPFLAKFDSDGNPLWARSAKGSISDYARSVAVDSSGCVYIAGSFYSTNIQFGAITLTNATLPPAGRLDAYVAKYSPSGDLIWVKGFGGVEDEQFHGVCVDASSNVLVVGGFSSPTVSFGPHTLTNVGSVNSQISHDVMVAKLDPQGGVIWATAAGGRGAGGIEASDMAFGVAVDTNGNAYVSGFFSAEASFGTNVITSGISGSTLFLAKYNPDGTVAWVRNGGVFGGEPRVALDVAGNPYVGLYFSGTFVHGSTVSTNVGGNGFDPLIAKYHPDGKPAWAATAGGYGDDRMSSLAIDRLGNVILAGSFTGTNTTFGSHTLTNTRSTLVSGPRDDLFVAKIAPPISLAGAVLNNDFKITVFGAAGRAFRIDSSTNLTDWNTLRNVTGQGFQDDLLESIDASGVRRFFRVITP